MPYCNPRKLWPRAWPSPPKTLDAWASWGRSLFEHLAPGRCLVCGVVLSQKKQGQLCVRCGPFLEPRLGGFCPGCGYLQGDTEAPLMHCAVCRRSPPPWETLAFFGLYTGVLRDLILEYKLQGRLGHVALLAECLAHCYRTHLRGQGWDTLVPVPLHQERLRRRGFNQSREAVRPWAKYEGLSLESQGLVRVRRTRSQTGLTKAERENNVRDAFMANGGGASWATRSVILVDDVFTTGATLRACARTLQAANVRRLAVLTLARAE